MRPIILDTDIGNDVDDIFALIMLAKMTRFRLVGVTTVYGDTRQEARMTRLVLDRLGRVDVPVHPGAPLPISGGPVLRGPHVGGGFPPEDLGKIQCNPAMPAADFLVEQAKLRGGDLEILAIGPLTNIAQAIKRDPEFAAGIKRITIMGGMVDPDRNPVWLEIISRHNGEYNIACDIDASKIVLGSGIPLTLIPLDVTTTVEFTQKQRAYFARMPFGLGDILARELDIWWNITAQIDEEKDCRSHPHDPVAAVALYDRSYFEFRAGRIGVGPSRGLGAMTIFEPDPEGPSETAVTVKREIVDEIVRRVVT